MRQVAEFGLGLQRLEAVQEGLARRIAAVQEIVMIMCEMRPLLSLLNVFHCGALFELETSLLETLVVGAGLSDCLLQEVRVKVLLLRCNAALSSSSSSSTSPNTRIQLRCDGASCTLQLH